MYKLTDDNYEAYKAHYGIPGDFQTFREHYPFGYCPTFKRYVQVGPGKWEIDEEARTIYIHEGRKWDWETLKRHLFVEWVPQGQEDINWKDRCVGENGRGTKATPEYIEANVRK